MIRLLPNGSIEFDTVQEAREYMEGQIEGGKIEDDENEATWDEFQDKKEQPKKLEPWPTQDQKIHWSEKAESILRTIGSTNGISSALLSKRTGYKFQSIGPIIKGIHDQCKRAGINPNKFLKKMKIDGKTTYFLDEELAKKTGV